MIFLDSSRNVRAGFNGDAWAKFVLYLIPYVAFPPKFSFLLLDKFRATTMGTTAGWRGRVSA